MAYVARRKTHRIHHDCVPEVWKPPTSTNNTTLAVGSKLLDAFDLALLNDAAPTRVIPAGPVPLSAYTGETPFSTVPVRGTRGGQLMVANMNDGMWFQGEGCTEMDLGIEQSDKWRFHWLAVFCTNPCTIHIEGLAPIPMSFEVSAQHPLTLTLPGVVGCGGRVRVHSDQPVRACVYASSTA